MFRGEMKCTDSDKNVILGNTMEFRIPSRGRVSEFLEQRERVAATSDGDDDDGQGIGGVGNDQGIGGDGDETVTREEEEAFRKAINSTARYVGLVVMPGDDVVRVEIEEFDREGFDRNRG